MHREFERSLQEYSIDCFKSISSVLPEIELVNARFIIDVDKVDQNNYERTRSNRQKDKLQRYAYIAESRVGELILNFNVNFVFDNSNPDQRVEKILPYTVKLLVPLPDEDGYLLIKGKKYLFQYQLTESTTYTTSSALVLKSLMPIQVRKKKLFMKDIYGAEYELHAIEVLVFKKYENPMYFYFATMGWSNALEYLSVGQYISVVEDYDDQDDKYIYFKVSTTVTLKVKRKAIASDYVRSILGTIGAVLNNRMTNENIHDKDMWISRIGAFKTNTAKSSHHEMGKRHIMLFNRMLDESNKEELKLVIYNKRDVYAIIRWLMQNFKECWAKDNLDILTKRLRCNECINSLLNTIISDKIKRFVNTTANTAEKLEQKYDTLFSFRGNEIITKAHSSGLMRFDEMVNDMDFFQKFKFTQKGANSAGNRSSKTISSRQRALHPSHLGRIDLNVCSASDPGLTNYIVPTCETDGLYFKDAPPEPESFYYNMKKELGEIDEEDCMVVIVDPVKYNLILDTISQCEFRAKEKNGD